MADFGAGPILIEPTGGALLGGHDASPLATESAGGSGPDVTPPAIVLVSPLGNAPIDPDDPIVIDITDNTPPVIGLSVLAFIGDCVELVATGGGYATRYSTSTTSPILDGQRYTVRRTGGWPPGPLRIDVRAFDAAGN